MIPIYDILADKKKENHLHTNAFDIPFDTKGDLTDFDAVVEAEKDHQASPSYI